MTTRQNKLLTRQWRLKDYLEEHRGKGFISVEKVCKDLSEFYTYNTNPYSHDKCVILSADVRSINWNDAQGYQIIIKDSKGGIKYAETEEEFNEWREKELAKVERKYQYLNNLKFKSKMDGLMPIINQADNPVPFDELKEVQVFKGGN